MYLNHLEENFLVSQVLANYFFSKGRWSPEWKPLKLSAMYVDSATLIIIVQLNYYVAVLGDRWSDSLL